MGFLANAEFIRKDNIIVRVLAQIMFDCIRKSSCRKPQLHTLLGLLSLLGLGFVKAPSLYTYIYI